MKALFLFLCFLFLFTISAAEEDAAVRDTDGDHLMAGNKYYIVPTLRGSGGGLLLSDYNSEGCEITVAQSGDKRNRGIPWSFHPADPAQTHINISESLNIKSVYPVACTGSIVWRIGSADSASEGQLIQLAGSLGDPSCWPYTTTWFKIEKGKYQNSYKFVYNPEDICPEATEDSNLSIGVGSGARTLVLPFNSRSRAFDFGIFKVRGSDRAYVQ
ncbi:kunitz trypsin inhibitor 5-like [Andrographis paniculata]|uniref:kunitz trypsin inhibitor 5-like n=1 Tax=Andrographis paniculata TaxID=175694 RepID=UPI0021E755A2|nr:kunitz trypsin inhibitor 5-like [Andrographis paniculata]